MCYMYTNLQIYICCRNRYMYQQRHLIEYLKLLMFMSVYIIDMFLFRTAINMGLFSDIKASIHGQFQYCNL